VLAVSLAAARAGVRTGDALAHARSVCTELCVRVTSPARERAARSTLLDVAFSVAPRAVLVPPRSAGPRAAEAVVHLDISGTRRVFASEAALAETLVMRAAALGVPAVAAVAGTRVIAELAARDLVSARRVDEPRNTRRSARNGARAGAGTGEGIGVTRVLAPGDEAGFLAPLPVDRLDLGDALAATLTRFGIRRTGALLALPPAALATRLGTGAAALWTALRGDTDEPPLPVPHDLRLEEAVDLDAPIDRLEPLGFVLHGLLSRLLGRLAVRHLACAELELTLRLSAAPDGTTGRGGCDVRRLQLAAPAGDPRLWLRRVQTALATEPPTAAVEGCALAAEGVPFRHDQIDLFRPSGPAPAALGALLTELEALCGPERIGAPHAPEDPRPGAFGLRPFAPDSTFWTDAARSGAPGSRASGLRASGSCTTESCATESRATGSCAAGSRASRNSNDAGAEGLSPRSLAVRALRPPVPAEVRIRAGQPIWLRSAVAHGDIVSCAGPWRATGGWWSEDRRFAFDSFDIATAEGLLLRLRYDHVRRAWEIDALYD
jgi:protein ImuB